jgi:hypothetical protein
MLGGEIAQATVIYHELFGNLPASNGNNTAIGWWHQLDYSGAHAKYSEFGTDPWGNSYNGWDIGGANVSGGSDMEVGSVNSNPLKPDADSNGYNYIPLGAGNSAFIYTDEYIINPAQWTAYKASFYPSDDAPGTTYRMVVGISPDQTGNTQPIWYVSAATGTVTGTNDFDARVYIDTAANQWHSLTANYETGALVGVLPAGYIVAFGLQTENSDITAYTNRLDNFMLEATAVPEPAAMLLASVGGLGLMSHRRRK